MEDLSAVQERVQREPVDRGRLTAALRTVWPDVAVASVRILHGGLSSVLHRVTVTGAPVDTFVLRQLLAEFGDDPDTLRHELVAHEELPRHGIAVPVAHWSDPDGDVLGRPAVALADVRGRVMTPDLAAATAQRALAATIARLAGVPIAGLSRLAVLRDVDAHADRFGPPATASELVDGAGVEAQIDASRRWFVGREQLVHCDLHGGNVLWDGTAVTGVLDWPGVAIGVAACDEAYAWLDTGLALGRAAADALQAAVDAARVGPEPHGGEIDLWRGVALRRALPTPGPWAASYRAAGIDVSDEQVEERFVQLVDDHLRGA